MLLYSCLSVNGQKSDIHPLRKKLKNVPESAIFKMEGFYLWDPSVIKVGKKYHLFCSRWPIGETGMEGWKQSHVIRAESKSLFGPYEFKEKVILPEDHPWAKQGVHNPKIIKVGGKYLLYHLGIPMWQTGFAFADSIEGPWEILKSPTINTNNPALVEEEGGSIYAVGKHKPKPHTDGRWDAYMHAFKASNYRNEFIAIDDDIGDTLNLLPNNYELEDPTIWIHNSRYHVLCTDWESKVTGIDKAIVHYTSKDGIRYDLTSHLPVWSIKDGIPLSNGIILPAKKIERPQVFLNKKNELIALLAAVLPDSNKPSFIVIRPVDNFIPKDE